MGTLKIGDKYFKNTAPAFRLPKSNKVNYFESTGNVEGILQNPQAHEDVLAELLEIEGQTILVEVEAPASVESKSTTKKKGGE